ncbi:hypothetical protein PMAYCL1PPCAC_28039, partial [Pristionchus mayeri]
QSMQVTGSSQSSAQQVYLVITPTCTGMHDLSGVPLTLLLSILRTNEDCVDLANLAQVNKYYRNGPSSVKSRMLDCKLKPALKKVSVTGGVVGLDVTVEMYPYNSSFFDTNMLGNRFEHNSEDGVLIIYVNVRDRHDPVIEKVSGLLSTSIKTLSI